jgi:hypothetical protein
MFIDKTGVKIRGKMATDSMTEWKNMYNEMIGKLGLPEGKGLVYQGTWYESQVFFAGYEEDYKTNTTEVPKVGYDEHDTFFAKSITVPEATPFTYEALCNFFKYAMEQGKSAIPWFSIINLYGGPDSQINIKNHNKGAYKDRDSLWVVQNYGHVAANTKFPQEGLDFIEGLNNAMTVKMPNTAFGAYPNYIDPSLNVSIVEVVNSDTSMIDKFAGNRSASALLRDRDLQ